MERELETGVGLLMGPSMLRSIQNLKVVDYFQEHWDHFYCRPISRFNGVVKTLFPDCTANPICMITGDWFKEKTEEQTGETQNLPMLYTTRLGNILPAEVARAVLKITDVHQLLDEYRNFFQKNQIPVPETYDFMAHFVCLEGWRDSLKSKIYRIDNYI